MKCVRFWFCLIIILLVTSFIANSQVEVPKRITISSGGHIEFKVNSLYDYEQGVDYTTWRRTTLKVYVDTLLRGLHTDIWYLEVNAQTSEFQCNFPSQSLPLDYVTLEALSGAWSSTGEVQLDANDDSFQTLLNNGDAGSYKVDVQYRLDSTMGRAPGYYSTNFIFRVDTIK